MTFANGNVYQGEFKDGEAHGQGTPTSEDGKILYEGNWDNGKRHGQGKTTATMAIRMWVNFKMVNLSLANS